MLSSSLIAVAFAGAATAFTPVGFEPASTNNLTVAFGNTLAINGVNLPKAEVQTAPTVGTTEKLVGTYTLMMVDPDIPPATAGGATSELLHWMQSDLVSANTTTTIGGMKVFELINPTNTTAFASYIGPAPPNKSPTTHRYTQLLLNTTGSSSALTSLKAAGVSRANFSAVNVVKNAGLSVLFGNSFNVSAATNTTAGAASGTNGTTTASGTAKASGTAAKASTSTAVRTTSVAGATVTAAAGNSTTASPAQSTGGVAGRTSGNEAIFAGLGAIAAAVIIL
ncbi:Protein FLOWERING LOCUS T [Lachnellula suecica]|uniref:Protein FLOWERING LOCUS T n=1 Tax=Lachnellula suecica TaxID=602035 RepID=A0A8T9C896_9HELO|nr:Protein FLOWERING LOCUS T [Lachnellula suecica]